MTNETFVTSDGDIEWKNLELQRFTDKEIRDIYLTQVNDSNHYADCVSFAIVLRKAKRCPKFQIELLKRAYENDKFEDAEDNFVSSIFNVLLKGGFTKEDLIKILS